MTRLKLDGCKVAVLVADGFEQSELFEPKLALVEVGACTEVISTKNGEIRGWNHDMLGDICAVDRELYGATHDEFDALFLPGGAKNLENLRAHPEAAEFVRGFVAAGKPIAAICHGPQLLADAGALSGRKITSYPALQGEMESAGAIWVNEPVVTYQGLVTSRTPDDIPMFSRKMIEEFAEGVHRRRMPLDRTA